MISVIYSLHAKLESKLDFQVHLKYFTCPGCIIRICFAKFATNAASGDEVTMNSRLVFRHTKLWVRITSHCGVLFS